MTSTSGLLQSLQAAFSIGKIRTRKRNGRRNGIATAFPNAVEVIEERCLLSGATVVYEDVPIPPPVRGGGGGGGGGNQGKLSPLAALPVLNSRPGAPVTLVLDFDGHSEDDPGWINFRDDGLTGNVLTPAYDIDGDYTTFSAEEMRRIEEIWYRVSEDYAPFDVNVTTIEPASVNDFEAVLVSIGGDGAWAPPAGGWGVVGGFNNSGSNTAYVFSELFGAPHDIASAVSHEAGHEFGLGHHSTWNADGTKNQEYNPGNANRAPLMGVGYYTTRDVWDNSEGSAAANQLQDDLAILTGAQNRTFKFRTDLQGDTTTTAADLLVTNPQVSARGVIEQSNDRDWFRFETNTGPISFTAEGLNLRKIYNDPALTLGTNLDIVLSLYDSDGNVIASNTPANSLSAALTANVQQGTYFIGVSGTGEYGALGQYTLSGTVIPLPSTPTMIAPTGTLAVLVPFFQWTVGANADHYELQVDNLTTGRFGYYTRNVTALNHTAANQFEQGDYQARVRTVTADGTFSEWSNYVDFTIDIPSPAKPRITRPSGDIVDSFPTFAWTGDANTSTYSLWVTSVKTNIRVIYRTQYAETSYVHFDALPDATYRAWVRAFNSVGEYSGWSDFVEFTIDAPIPEAPKISAPAAITTNPNARIAWNAVDGAARYDLWVNNLTTGQSPYIRNQNISRNTTYFDPPALPQGSYVAWVRAANGNNEFSPWSLPHAFTVDVLPPTVPTMTGPVGANASQTVTTTNPTFTWTAAERAVQYDLWVNNVTTGQVQIIRQQNLTDTKYVALNNLPQGNYRAWVRGINSANEVGNWSTVFIFTIDEPTPSVPTITEPKANPAGSVDNPNPTFQWTADFDAPYYNFRLVDETLNGKTVINVSGIQTKSYTIPNAQRLVEHTYVATVRATNKSGEISNWSAPFRVRIDVPNPTTPVIVGPTGTSNDRTPTFQWVHDKASYRYEILVRDLERAESIVLQVTAYQLDPTGQFAFYTLPDNKAFQPGTYRFWIRAFSSIGTTSSWSDAKTFVISASLDIKDLKIVEPAKLEFAAELHASAEQTPQPEQQVTVGGSVTGSNISGDADYTIAVDSESAMSVTAIEEIMESLSDPASAASVMLSATAFEDSAVESKSNRTSTLGASLLALAVMPIRRRREEK